ncbi:MAG: lamin tail domain-containing protein [Roseibacillus sp.]|nr:lamin tail domain-containing protein [Roseibacillus sp.]|tara:strand:- start:9151 stop:13068 length:3918 start_codon:yes stop_codon:yes gene_type:complete
MRPITRYSGAALYLALACTTITSVPLRAQSLVIQEFMASNQDTINDEDGDNEDWIEIFNPGGAAINLDGWFLTDDAATLNKWAFPGIILSPGEQLLVFASNKNRNDPASELHTNFKLTSQGEYLALVRPDGSTVEHHYAPTFPLQVQDVSYGLQQSTSSSPLISPGVAMRYKVPVNGDDDVREGTNPNSWIGTEFPDSSWNSGTTGVGYATGSPDAYDPLIETDVQALMWTQRSSIYLRIPFTITDPSAISGLNLKMKWDDGFVVYLNGDPLPVAEENAPSPDQLDYQSSATSSHSDSQALVYDNYSLSSSLLTVGSNALCIHGLNTSTGSSDFLILPELEATSVTDMGTPAYFTTPTPNAPNTSGGSTPGPLIRSVTRNLPPLSLNADPLVIEAEVLPTMHPINTVTLTWRVMYGTENTVTMTDDGSGDDAVSGDGIYTTTISTSTLSNGEMIRWKVTATDTADGSSRQPQFPDRFDSPEYFGTIAEDPSLARSNLPVFHWFTSSPGGANTTNGSRGSVYFLGQFYDNIQADRHGQSTGGFPKKSYDFDFNKGDRFRYQEGEARVKDLNMLTNWADKSKTRNTLGYEIVNRAGEPAHFAFPVRIQQNAAFFSTADMVEDGDERYLERVGLDGEGALYKMYNRLDSSTSGVNKKTRKNENNSDLQALVSGLSQSGDAKLRYGYDNIDIPGTINYLAALDLTNNRDHGHKNYYLYRDTNGSREWRPLVWDIDLCLGRNWVSGPAYFDDSFTNNNLRAGPSNRLKTFIFSDSILNQMYLRRMRSLMDKQIGPPASPVNYLVNRVDDLVALIDPRDNGQRRGSDDADLDYQKWGSWGNQNAMRPAADRIKFEHVPSRRAHLYGLSEIPPAQPVASPIRISSIDYNPVANGASPDQRGEYFILVNPNRSAVDCSDWVISGGISHTLPAGTVIPARGRLYVAREATGFRARSISPKANEKRYLISGYDGQLSARGETITLTDDAGNLIDSVAYTGNPTPGQDFLRVSEILYAPAAPTAAELASIATLNGSEFEFVELTNIGPSPLDISGAQFVEGISFTFPAATILNPGDHILVVANLAAFSLRHPGGLNIAGEYTGKLDNDGEQLQILDALGENILEFSYNDVWHDPTDDDGYSLVLLDPATTPVTDFDRPANWGVSLTEGGDPGTESTGTSMTYAFWKYQHFTENEMSDPLVTGDSLDLDSDTLGTVLEYGFGRNPRTSDAAESYRASIVNDGGTDYLAMTFRRQKNSLDLTYLVEVSSDLSDWTTVNTLTGTPVDNGDGTETVTIRDNAAVSPDTPRFGRITVAVGP